MAYKHPTPSITPKPKKGHTTSLHPANKPPTSQLLNNPVKPCPPDSAMKGNGPMGPPRRAL